MEPIRGSEKVTELTKIVQDTLHYFHGINPTKRSVQQPWLLDSASAPASDTMAEDVSEYELENTPSRKRESIPESLQDPSKPSDGATASTDSSEPASIDQAASPLPQRTSAHSLSVPVALTRQASELASIARSISASDQSGIVLDVAVQGSSPRPALASPAPSSSSRKTHERTLSHIVGDDRYNPNINKYTRMRLDACVVCSRE